MDGKQYFQHVSAFMREGHLMMTSNMKTTEGLWYLHPPIVILNTHAPFSEIGDAVFDALGRSQTGFPEPPGPAELDETMEQIFSLAGVQIFDHFLEGTLHLGIGQEANGIELSPTTAVLMGMRKDFAFSLNVEPCWREIFHLNNWGLLFYKGLQPAPRFMSESKSRLVPTSIAINTPLSAHPLLIRWPTLPLT